MNLKTYYYSYVKGHRYIREFPLAINGNLNIVYDAYM